MSDLHERAAKALGWSVRDAQSLSMQALRELVRPVDSALAQEMDYMIRSGAYIRGEPLSRRGRTRDHATMPAALSPEEALRLAQLPDAAICNAEQGGSRGLWYASVALEKRWPSDPDFATTRKNKHAAIRSCAAKVRADLRGKGAYAPHWSHYDMIYRLLPYWEQRAKKDPKILRGPGFTY
jgi:hypothetical protein